MKVVQKRHGNKEKREGKGFTNSHFTIIYQLVGRGGWKGGSDYCVAFFKFLKKTISRPL